MSVLVQSHSGRKLGQTKPLNHEQTILMGAVFIFYFFVYIHIWIPKIINNEEMVATRLRKVADLEPDKIGILTPKTGEILLESIDIAITPGLGFTKRCERLGYGRGYYDRWFSKNHAKIKIGVAFETQLVNSLPLEKTDITMDILITEKKVIKKK